MYYKQRYKYRRKTKVKNYYKKFYSDLWVRALVNKAGEIYTAPFVYVMSQYLKERNQQERKNTTKHRSPMRW